MATLMRSSTPRLRSSTSGTLTASRSAAPLTTLAISPSPNFYDFGSPSGTGGVIVFPGGGPSGTDYPAPGYLWPAGYDKTGNTLVAEGNYAGSCTSPGIAKLTGGTWTVLSYNQTIYFPAAVELMGKTWGVGDQEGGGVFDTDIYATKISGSSATAVQARTPSPTRAAATMTTPLAGPT